MYTPTHLDKWKLPKYYFGAQWPQHYVFLSRHRDSDILTVSNFEMALARLEALPSWNVHDHEELDPDSDDSRSRFVVREEHLLVGWVEWLAIHETDELALRAADEMSARLESYSVLDEADYSEREDKEAQEIWQKCYDAKGRAQYLRDNWNQCESVHGDFRSLRQVMRGEWFPGYASELIH